MNLERFSIIGFYKERVDQGTGKGFVRPWLDSPTSQEIWVLISALQLDLYLKLYRNRKLYIAEWTRKISFQPLLTKLDY